MLGPRMKGRQYDTAEYQPKRRVGQKPLDPYCALINETLARVYRERGDPVTIQPHAYHSKDVFPAYSMRQYPISSAAPKWVHTIYFKNGKNAMGRAVRPSFSAMCFTPDGRRLVTGNSEGEFTLWHGTSLASEMRTAGHEDARVNCAIYCENADLLLSSDDKGRVKYWGSNMNNLEIVDVANTGIREVTASPSSAKFAAGSLEGLVRLYDTNTATLEKTMEGHGNEVLTCHWHTRKNLFASGGKDLRGGKVILWDPRCAESISSLLGHSAGVNRVRWSPTEEYWLLTGSMDTTIKLFDLRKMQELYTFQGHKKDVWCLSWHPMHHGLFASGGRDGMLNYWIVGQGSQKSEGATRVCAPVSSVCKSHGMHNSFKVENGVSEVVWHPLGHSLASASFDCKFWTHNKPGGVEEVKGAELANVAGVMEDLRAKTRKWNTYVAAEAKEAPVAQATVRRREGERGHREDNLRSADFESVKVERARDFDRPSRPTEPAPAPAHTAPPVSSAPVSLPAGSASLPPQSSTPSVAVSAPSASPSSASPPPSYTYTKSNAPPPLLHTPPPVPAYGWMPPPAYSHSAPPPAHTIPPPSHSALPPAPLHRAPILPGPSSSSMGGSILGSAPPIMPSVPSMGGPNASYAEAPGASPAPLPPISTPMPLGAAAPLPILPEQPISAISPAAATPQPTEAEEEDETVMEF